MELLEIGQVRHDPLDVLGLDLVVEHDVQPGDVPEGSRIGQPVEDDLVELLALEPMEAHELITRLDFAGEEIHLTDFLEGEKTQVSVELVAPREDILVALRLPTPNLQDRLLLDDLRALDFLHEGAILVEREFDGGEVAAVDHQIKMRAGSAQSLQGPHVQELEEVVQDVVGKTQEGQNLWRWQLLPSPGHLEFLLTGSLTGSQD